MKGRSPKDRPLSGLRIVVTRAVEQAGGFSARLKAAGAEVIEFPTIETVPPESWDGLDSAIRRLGDFDYVVFTSVNALRFFLDRLGQLGQGAEALSGLKVVAVGPQTAREVEARGLKVSVIPKEYRAEGVVEALSALDLKGKRFLYPRAEVAREVLPEKLREMGAEVEVAVAYRTVAPRVAPEKIKELFDGGISAVTFTSSSTVKNFMQIVGEGAPGYLQGVCVASIGPVTAKTCEEVGVAVSVVPKDYTVDALLESLAVYFKKEK